MALAGNMPIGFRCHHCNQKLSVSRKKAGADVTCPTCAETTTVPTLAEAAAAKREQQQLDEADPDATLPEQESERSPDLDATVGGAATEEAASEPDVSPQAAELWQPHEELDPWQVEDDAELEEEFSLSRPSAEEEGLDMTPMVDVTFLLLIFFMITASFSLQKSLQTEAPEPDEEGAAQMQRIQDIEDASVIVSIDAEDNILVDDEPVAGLGQLVDVLTARMHAEQPPRTEMMIEADYNASHGTVVAVTDAGMEAGMQNIRRVSRGGED